MANQSAGGCGCQSSVILCAQMVRRRQRCGGADPEWNRHAEPTERIGDFPMAPARKRTARERSKQSGTFSGTFYRRIRSFVRICSVFVPSHEKAKSQKPFIYKGFTEQNRVI
jgi:hypothetical protein